MRSEAYRRRKAKRHPASQARDCYGLYKRVYPPLPSTGLEDYEVNSQQAYEAIQEWFRVCPLCDMEHDDCICPHDLNDFNTGPLTVSVPDAAKSKFDSFTCPTCDLVVMFMDKSLSRRQREFHAAGHCGGLWVALKDDPV